MSYTLQQRLAQLKGMGLADIGSSFGADKYATRSIPLGAPSDYAALCEACLRGRGFIYYKNTPGDCPSPQVSSAGIKAQIVSASGSAGSTILAAAGVLTGAALAGATLGIGIAVGALEEIWQHHAQAVATEQQTLCAVAGVVNQTIAAIDAAVKSGEINPSQGNQFMYALANKVNAGMNTILKTCNAACDYIGVMNAHVDFSNSYYDAIAPMDSVGAQTPGGPPTAFGSLPGGVPSTQAAPAPPPPIRSTAVIGDTSLIGANDVNSVTGAPAQSSGITGKSGEIPPTGPSWGLIMFAIIAGIIAIAIFGKGAVPIP